MLARGQKWIFSRIRLDWETERYVTLLYVFLVLTDILADILACCQRVR